MADKTTPPPSPPASDSPPSKTPFIAAGITTIVWIGILGWLASQYANPTVVPVRLLQDADLVVIGRTQPSPDGKPNAQVIEVEHVLLGDKETKKVSFEVTVNPNVGDDRRLRLLPGEGPSIVILHDTTGTLVARSPLRSSILEDEPEVREQVVRHLESRND